MPRSSELFTTHIQSHVYVCHGYEEKDVFSSVQKLLNVNICFVKIRIRILY